jgi:hypothetical protein
VHGVPRRPSMAALDQRTAKWATALSLIAQPAAAKPPTLSA